MRLCSLSFGDVNKILSLKTASLKGNIRANTPRADTPGGRRWEGGGRGKGRSEERRARRVKKRRALWLSVFKERRRDCGGERKG